MTTTETQSGKRTPVAQDLLDRILKPYKQHCRYLKRAEVECPPGPGANGHTRASADASAGALAIAHGEFEIPESWYIDDTGHFNSIEFNLCYNQLVYVLMGHCVANKLVAPLARLTLDEYARRQLPDVLIVRLESHFKKAMVSGRFRGRVWIRDASERGRLLMLRTGCEFEDGNGGFSEGEIVLAISHWPPGEAPEPPQHRRMD